MSRVNRSFLVDLGTPVASPAGASCWVRPGGVDSEMGHKRPKPLCELQSPLDRDWSLEWLSESEKCRSMFCNRRVTGTHLLI